MGYIMSIKSITSSFLLMGLVGAASTVSAAIPPHNVRLQCSPLSYVIDCSVARTANPELNSNCWLVSGNQSFLMNTDSKFNFFANGLQMHLHNGMAITGELTETATGNRAICKE